MTQPASQAREAFFPPQRLKRSDKSDVINFILYSASTSSKLGKDSRLELYIAPDELPSPSPDSIVVMIYIGGPPAAAAKSRVYALGLKHNKQPKSEPVCRYYHTETRTWGESARIGDLYLPKLMFSDTPPETCWLEVTIPAGTE